MVKRASDPSADLAATVQHCAELEAAGRHLEAAERLAEAMMRCKRVHDELIRGDAARRLQLRVRQRTANRARLRTIGATCLQAGCAAAPLAERRRGYGHQRCDLERSFR